jgi:exosome complex RNA-binding protein Rrp42 (RNase PH superfamily)
VAVDPSRIEEQVAIGRITVTLNRQGEIVSLVKVGGPGLDTDTITQHCLSLAKSQSAGLADTLNSLLKTRN